MEKSGYNDFLMKIFSHSTKKLSRGILLSFRKLMGSKNFMRKNFLSTSFLSYGTEIFRTRPLLCSRKNYSIEIYAEGWGGEYHTFPSKVFCLTTETFRRGTLCFRKLLVSKNFIDKRRESFTIFRRNFFVSLPKKFEEQPFRVSEYLWYRKFSCIRGYHDFPSY